MTLLLVAILALAYNLPVDHCEPHVVPEEDVGKILVDTKNGIVPPVTVGTKCKLK